MKRNNISKILIVGCIFLLCFSQVSFAQEKQYPPYPDVWERVFPDNIDQDGLKIAPNVNGDVVVDQLDRVDSNGDPVKKGKSGSRNEALLFFEGKAVDRNAKQIVKGETARKYTKQTHSYGTSDFVSRDISPKDGGKIRWMKALVTDAHGQYDAGSTYKRQVVDGVVLHQSESMVKTIDDSIHTVYYNRPTVLEKIDSDGRPVWQKVYLYFHPWWRTVYQKDEGEIDALLGFMYFKLGTLALLSEERMFVYFGGARKIFRLASDGNPKTQDKNLVVMEYNDYKQMAEGLIVKLDMYKKTSPRLVLTDYDYLGEQLAKKRGIDTNSPEVRGVAIQHKDLAQDIDLYYREMEKRGAR